MCGIVGTVVKSPNGLFQKEISVFETLLYMDTLRGQDSTGVALLNNNGSATIIKETTPGYWFLQTQDYEELSKEAYKHGKCLIGHNRKKTVGTVSDQTAHPFVIDNRYVFVHNGTLFNHKELHDTEVDSEALGMLITRCDGDKEKLQTELARVSGAYACAWFDKQKMKLYLLRNKERPLCLGKTTQGWHFASEFGMLYAATSREGLKLEVSEVVPENTLLEFDLTKGHDVGYTSTELVIPKKATPTVVHTNHRGFTKMVHTSSTKQKKSKTGIVLDVEKGGELSKNAFKRFRHEFKKGTRIEFWMDDVLPTTVDGSLDTSERWIYMGESLSLDIKHTVKGIHKAPEKELKDMLGGMCTAVVYDLEYSKDGRFVEILTHSLETKKYYATKTEAALH